MAQWDMTVTLENRTLHGPKMVYDARRIETRVWGRTPPISGNWQSEWEIRDFGRINDRDWPLLHKVCLQATKTSLGPIPQGGTPQIPIDPTPLWLRTQEGGTVDLSKQLDDRHFYWIPHSIVVESKKPDGTTGVEAYIRLESMLHRNHFLAFQLGEHSVPMYDTPLILRSDGPRETSPTEWDWLYFRR